ncbi:tachylectin-related carbohydrate-binding protein [Streptomyces sp. NPDC057193]|uniref:tachylectin-related carbohydrate-binding protein n=1 Tax=Streptomyces sp. NPDC057193 TaxID=3346043 RepID=UPI00363C6496
MALVIATALAVGIAPAVLGGAPAVAAPALAGAATEGVTVVQEGGPLVVPSGEEGAVTTRIKVTLPAGHSGPVRARLLLPDPTWELPDFDTPAYEPVTATCAANGGVFWSCPWDSPGNEVVFPAVEASQTVTYDVRVNADSRAAVMGNLTASFEVTGADGAVIGRGPIGFHFVKGTPENYLRTTVLARDKAGVLWQYPSSGRDDTPLRARQRIGGGWNAYTSLTSLTYRTAAGEGDLVARDKTGVLWYYEGSGNPAAPFKSRVRVGGGWNAYTAITGRGGGLVARDRDGVLWIHAPNNAGNSTEPFAPRRRVGGGWNTYTAIVGQGSDYNAVARDTGGVLWSYGYAFENGTGPYSPRRKVGGGWNAYNALTWAQNLNSHGRNDLVARDKEGRIWLYETISTNYGAVPVSSRKQIGWGWGIYDAIL